MSGRRAPRLCGHESPCIRFARANRLNGARCPRHLLSGLLECGVCGGPYAMRGLDRYGCSSHVMNGSCPNGRGIRRAAIEERVLSGLKDRLIAPEVAAEAMRAHAEETNLINRKEQADVDRRVAALIAVIEDGGYVRGMVDRLSELEARQDELNERLSAAPADLPDIHPNIADVYRRRVALLAVALDHPGDRDAATAAIRNLIDLIVLTPGKKWGEMDAVLHGDFGTILEWAGGGNGNVDTSAPEMSVSVVAGVGIEPMTFRLRLEFLAALRLGDGARVSAARVSSSSALLSAPDVRGPAGFADRISSMTI